MATLGDLIVRVGASIDGFTTAMASVMDQMDDVGQKAEERLAGVEAVGKRLAVLGAGLTAAVTLPMEELGRHSLEVAAQFEQTQVAYTTFLGSSEAAKTKLAELYQFAATTPFEVAGVLQASRTLLAMQFAAKDVVPIMRTLGDAAAGLGLGQEGLQRLVFHLGQIRAEGAIDKRILNELGQMGISAGQMLADGLGKSVPEVLKMISEKAIDGNTAINALLAGMNKQFGGLSADQMQTLSGQWSNFKDNITLTLVDIGNALLPVAKQFLAFAAALTQDVKEIAQWFAALPAPVQAGVGAILAMVAAAGPLLTAIGGVMAVLPTVVSGFTTLAAVVRIAFTAITSLTSLEAVAALLVSIATGPVAIAVAVAASIAALTALGVWIAQHWDGIKAAVAQAWDGLKEIWANTIGRPVMELIQLFEAVYSKTDRIWTAVGLALRTAWDFIKREAMEFWGFLKNIFDQMFQAVEKIPGVTKVLSAGSAFAKADSAAQEKKAQAAAIADAEHTLRLGSASAPHLTDQKSAWLDKHKEQIEKYTKAVHTLEDAYKRGAVSADTLHQAQERLHALTAEKMPKFDLEEKKGKTKVDHNALDELSGVRAHEHALAEMRRAAIEHEYQMSQIRGQGIEEQVAAAQHHREELDKLAAEELESSLKTIDEKLKLYKHDQAGYEKLIAAKLAAQDKFDAVVQRNAFAVEAVEKRASDQRNREIERQAEQAARKQEQDAKRHADAMVEIADTLAQSTKSHEEAMAAAAERRLDMELDLGQISKTEYLRLKQEQYDRAYQMELEAIARERAALAESLQPDSDEYKKRSAKLDAREQGVKDRHSERTQDIQGEGLRHQNETFFRPIEGAFGEGLRSMIEGTKTFRQAWADMARSMLDSWISTLAQMAARWVAHKAMELLLHVTTNHAKVASDATAAAASNSIGLTQHIREMMRAAAAAAGRAWQATVGIPVVGPILAPIAAAASFAGVMAFSAVSAERGAVLPDENTVGFLHPKEMVLPRHLSEGLQTMIANGGNMLANPNAVAHAQGGSMSSTALQALTSASRAGGSGDTNFHGGVQITVTNSAKDPMTADKVMNLFQEAVRMRNLKMA